MKYFEKNLAMRERNACSSIVAHYFYTRRGTILESTHENMLRSILHSILQQDESTFFHFQLELRNFQRCNRSKWPYESLKNVLSSFANHPSTRPMYLILDAMDESNEDDRRSIIQLLFKLCLEENPCKIKVFLVSRPVVELRSNIEEHHHVICMQDENNDDISRFANDFLSSDLKLTGKILHEATRYIASHAYGVFLWVSLLKTELISYVETAFTNADILDILDSLPRELEDFYEFKFRKLESGQLGDIRDGIKIFRFVLFTFRPLTVIEICEALAVTDDRNPPYEEFQQNRIYDIIRRINHCGGNFLEITGN